MTPDQKLAFIVKHTGLEFKSKLLDETAGFEVSSEASSPMEVLKCVRVEFFVSHSCPFDSWPWP